MACRDCFNNCDGTLTSDKCVKYTGPDIEWLGICTGDQLSVVLAAIILKLGAIADGTGTGIIINDLDIPDVIDDALDGEDPNLKNILQAIFDIIASLQEDIDDIQSETEDPISFNADCLTLSTTPSRDEILQAVVTETCANSAAIDIIGSDYVKASELCSLVEECISTGDSVTTQENTKMPKYVALPYHGSLSVFDANGKGLASAGYDKVYLCIGQVVNGFTLPDYRGRTPVGVNTGMPGGAMDSAVDPALPANIGYNITQGVKKGNFTHTLTSSQLAAHTHGITDPGHTHTITYQHDKTDSNESGADGNLPNFDAPWNSTQLVTSSTTGITIGSTGNSQPHNNTQPSMGAAFIMYVP